MIPFNKPYLTGNETEYLKQAADSGKLSGNGMFTQKCHEYFEDRYGFKKCLLTTSCTDALEMAALLTNIQPGDEVIVPSYTFVSSALAFVRQGATIRFADSQSDHPNIDANSIENLITNKTKALVIVHYAGVSCDMESILRCVKEHGIYLIEDAAQAIESSYEGRQLGTFGDLSAFSFHETKNIIAGEGGLLGINNDVFSKRAEILWEKGTNRAEFFRGQVNKYGWVDTGSSFLPSELTAAFLYAQLEEMEPIQNRRKEIWNYYFESFQALEAQGKLGLPHIPSYAENNGHMFYMVCKDIEQRDRLIQFLRARDILAVFHYQSLHKSDFYREKHDGRELPHCDHFNDCLIRLPLFYELMKEDQEHIITSVKQFYEGDE